MKLDTALKQVESIEFEKAETQAELEMAKDKCAEVKQKLVI